MPSVGPEIQQETLKNVENETQTLFHLEYGEKHSKMFKNVKCTLQDLKCGEQTENNEK